MDNYAKQVAAQNQSVGVYIDATPPTPKTVTVAIDTLSKLRERLYENRCAVTNSADNFFGSQPETALGGLGNAVAPLPAGIIGQLFEVIDGISAEMGRLENQISRLRAVE
jgi:hypothetical protein